MILKIQGMSSIRKACLPVTDGWTGREFRSHGHSDTESDIRNLSGERLQSLPVRNTSEVPGSELVQLYIRKADSGMVRPEKVLRSFKKVLLAPGEEKIVELPVCEGDLRYFDDNIGAWVTEKGEYELLLGASSCDIRSRLVIRI